MISINIILYAIFLFLIVIQFVIDFTSDETRKCLKGPNSKEVFVVLLFHHVLSTFLLYGWLLPNKKLLVLYIISFLFMFAQWEIYGYCVLTKYVNIRCGDTNNTKYFRDLLWKLGTKEKVVFSIGKTNISLFTIIVLLFLVFGVIHLFLF